MDGEKAGLKNVKVYDGHNYFANFSFSSTCMKRILITLMLIAGIVTLGKTQDTAKIVHTNPPFLNFYTKTIYANGIPVRSGSVVDDQALFIAREKVMMMLKHMPNAHANLIKNGAELHIIGRK